MFSANGHLLAAESRLQLAWQVRGLTEFHSVGVADVRQQRGQCNNQYKCMVPHKNLCPRDFVRFVLTYRFCYPKGEVGYAFKLVRQQDLLKYKIRKQVFLYLCDTLHG